MREIAEIELAIQGGTEKIETLGTYHFFLSNGSRLFFFILLTRPFR